MKQHLVGIRTREGEVQHFQVNANDHEHARAFVIEQLGEAAVRAVVVRVK